MRNYRIGVAGFLHESNSFLARLTQYEDFASTSLTSGEAMRERWAGASHELGGMVGGAEGLEIVPLYATFAVPSGPIEREAFLRIAAELTSAIRAAMPLDGLLLALHGATVAEGFPDADGEMLSRIRAAVGKTMPILCTFDLHANISQRMADLSTALIGYRTNPHLDQRERGTEAAQLLARTLRGEVRPVQWLEKPPMVLANSRQYTSQEPAKLLYDGVREAIAQPGILSASVAMGFPHSDVEEVGLAAIAVADGDRGRAQEHARALARRAWNLRSEFESRLPSVEEAVRQAASAEAYPVALMDVGDNVGGGGAADSTVLLEELLRQGARGGLIVLHDPAGVETCVAAGVRNKITHRCRSGLELHGRVRLIGDGVFEETQVRHGGWKINDQGISAVVETEEEHTIVLTSRRMAPFSLEQLISLGVHPERKRVLIVKGVIAPRAAYEPVARQFILVDSPGETADNPARLPYRNRRRPLYPLEKEASY
ncbi:MAG: M81 family metallopeptidase [Bryobacteraceae bacterium]